MNFCMTLEEKNEIETRFKGPTTLPSLFRCEKKTKDDERHRSVFMLNMFIFLMIKDTLLPTVQKTHIGKYRTFPDNLQTAEKELASTCERWRGEGQRWPRRGRESSERARHC